uniref:Uncharacterized protein n=1 Tax=Panagrolaimus davidi TaxID=227884 RepID=A0A914PTJ1_9BILA
MYGEDLFISFCDKKQKYGFAAAEDYRKNPNFVVFGMLQFFLLSKNFAVLDLIKIMSMLPNSKIEADPSWGFTFTENAENPLLIQFDNFDGNKKAASPAFLMAMLLKHHLKIIKSEIGEKPKELGFWLLDKFKADEKERIKNGIKDACTLLKVSFVEVNV